MSSIFLKYFNSTKNFTFEIREMLTLSKEVIEWMAEDKRNIVVIHCKGGKGKNIFLFISLFVEKCEKHIKVQDQDILLLISVNNC